MTENNLRKTLMLFKGDVTKFLEHPIALGFLAAIVAIAIIKLFFTGKLKHEAVGALKEETK